MSQCHPEAREGAVLLENWLLASGLRSRQGRPARRVLDAFHRRICRSLPRGGEAPKTLSSWYLVLASSSKKPSLPRYDIRMAIEAVTKGAVPLESWCQPASSALTPVAV